MDKPDKDTTEPRDLRDTYYPGTVDPRTDDVPKPIRLSRNAPKPETIDSFC